MDEEKKKKRGMYQNNRAPKCGGKVKQLEEEIDKSTSIVGDFNTPSQQLLEQLDRNSERM